VHVDRCWTDSHLSFERDIWGYERVLLDGDVVAARVCRETWENLIIDTTDGPVTAGQSGLAGLLPPRDEATTCS